MSIEEILRNAAQRAQNIFKGKSHNIKYYDVSILPEEKKSFYTDEGLDRRYTAFEELRGELLTTRVPSNRIYHKLISKQNSFLVGNCMLLAIFALQYLKNEHNQTLCQLFYPTDINLSALKSLLTLQLIVTLRPYNHAFSLICPPSYTNPKPKIGETYRPNQFPDGSWICDPWANIVCPAKNYDDKWKLKMAEWNHSGKALYLNRSNVQQDNDLNQSPLGKYAYTMVQMSHKTIDELITIFPNGDSKIKTHHSFRGCSLF
ncbi:hypothetical protein Xbed_00740 [Xenorhabdus beddingii]|uniref:Uncharacterized protein n=1 Tax=Xenorhabdus beddingii TaxID=40578 RepID=A0A1Y2SQ42_9GAMM|nr:hypothetical protein [Xenorhabdus beddingii]OTA21094.1 hypothetical protein Xbed_00740 [Xenorhabdus beddingii]